MRPHRWAGDPSAEPPAGVPVANPFVGSAVARRYARARPPLHDSVVARITASIPKPRRALDVGCGTGLSTEALATFADSVVGVDASEAMIRERPRPHGAAYVLSAAESMPFADDTFELATIASAIHWLDRGAFAEIGRVLMPAAVLVVYDIWFRGEMVDDASFGEWMRSMSAERYPPVPKQQYGVEELASIGFEPAGELDARLVVPMARDELVRYLMTHSERIAAVRDGRETELGQEAFLAEGLSRFFLNEEPRDLAFGAQVELFVRGGAEHRPLDETGP